MLGCFVLFLMFWFIVLRVQRKEKNVCRDIGYSHLFIAQKMCVLSKQKFDLSVPLCASKLSLNGFI